MVRVIRYGYELLLEKNYMQFSCASNPAYGVDVDVIGGGWSSMKHFIMNK